MDRQIDCVEYKEGEEVCDICQRSQESDLPIVQLPISSSNSASSSQEGLLELTEVENRLATSDVRFEDSSIGNSISS